MTGRKLQLIGLVVALAVGAHEAPAQMTFNIINQGGATAQMVAGVQEAADMWAARFSDPITINLRINATSLASGVIAHTDTFYDPYSYSSVRTALLADKHTADDLAATSHLQSGSAFSMLINKTANNPAGVVSVTPYFDTGLGGPGQAGAENNSTIRMSSANAKALGLYPANGGGTDGIITFATSASGYDFDRSNGIDANKIDFVGVAAHEIGHMLGFVSGVDVLAGNAVAPGLNDNQLKFVTTLDLFRFSTRSIGAGGGNGVIDWTDDSFYKYFSVDGGTTAMARFSTGSTYESSHWFNDLGLGLMDPTAVRGELLGFSSNDVRALDVIGYDVVPEPASVGVLAVGSLVLLARRRRRGR